MNEFARRTWFDDDDAADAESLNDLEGRIAGGFDLNSLQFGATGDGTADDTTALTAMLAAGPGQTVKVPDQRKHKFTSTLVIPPYTTLQLGMGSSLRCAVTGGVNGIELGEGAKIVGAGGGGASFAGGTFGSSIVALSGANVDALITNADHSIQEFFYLTNIYAQPFSGATMNSLVDLVSVYANSRLEGCILNGDGSAAHVLRVRPGPSVSYGQLGFADCWFLHPATEAVTIESTAAGGGNDLWFQRCLFETWGDGYAALDLNGTTNFIGNVSLRDCHWEHGGSASSRSWCVNARGAVGLNMDHGTFFLPNPANFGGIHFSPSGANQGGFIKNFTGLSTLSPILDDEGRPDRVTYDSKTIEFYEQGGATGGRVDFQGETHFLNAGFKEITGVASPDTNNATVFLRDNGSGKSQLVIKYADGSVNVIDTQV